MYLWKGWSNRTGRSDSQICVVWNYVIVVPRLGYKGGSVVWKTAGDLML